MLVAGSSATTRLLFDEAPPIPAPDPSWYLPAMDHVGNGEWSADLSSASASNLSFVVRYAGEAAHSRRIEVK